MPASGGLSFRTAAHSSSRALRSTVSGRRWSLQPSTRRKGVGRSMSSTPMGTYAGLAKEVGRLLNWEWEPIIVPWDQANHPFKIQSPYFCSDARLRETLAVTEPDPRDALAQTVEWLWEHGAEHYSDHLRESTPTARGPEKGG